MSIDNSNLEIGFWHPFGPHAGETAEQIIKRKKEEIEKNGWTLWSFQKRTKEFYSIWIKNINENNPINVLVFCSEGKGARDPKGEPKYYRHYKTIGENEWKKIPIDVHVPHPSAKNEAAAFIVKNIIYPTEHCGKINIEWLRRDGWRTDKGIPTRGEYLIKAGQGQFMRNYRAILELKYPYIAQVST
jgi:hypothetical protein